MQPLHCAISELNAISSGMMLKKQEPSVLLNRCQLAIASYWEITNVSLKRSFLCRNLPHLPFSEIITLCFLSVKVK